VRANLSEVRLEVLLGSRPAAGSRIVTARRLRGTLCRDRLSYRVRLCVGVEPLLVCLCVGVKRPWKTWQRRRLLLGRSRARGRARDDQLALAVGHFVEQRRDLRVIARLGVLAVDHDDPIAGQEPPRHGRTVADPVNDVAYLAPRNENHIEITGRRDHLF
jgi:hypothetical protein